MRKYKLPSTHPLFQNQTLVDLQREQLGDLWEEKFGLEAQLTDDPGMDAKVRRELQDRLATLDKALGVAMVFDDPQVAEWEADVAAGRTPNIHAGLENLKLPKSITGEELLNQVLDRPPPKTPRTL